MGTGNKMLGITCDGLASHPRGVINNTPSWLHATETSLARVQIYLTNAFNASNVQVVERKQQ